MRRLTEVDVHLFPNTPEGHMVLYQLQQRAEAWAEGVSWCTSLRPNTI